MMTRVLAWIAFFTCLVAAGQQPTSAPTSPKQESLLRRLYRLVWPKDYQSVNIGRAIQSATEKGAPLSDDVPHLYSVNVVTGVMQELAMARGAVRPTVCPDGMLVVQRGEELQAVRFGVEGNTAKAIGESKEITGVEVQRLHACTRNETGEIEIWVEAAGVVCVIRVNRTPAECNPPNISAFGETVSRLEIADDLHHLQSVRPDGFQVWVQDGALFGRSTESASEVRLVNDSSVVFEGTPVWLGDTRFVLVTGTTSE